MTGNSADLSWSRSWAQAAKIKSLSQKRQTPPAGKLLATEWLLKYGTGCGLLALRKQMFSIQKVQVAWAEGMRNFCNRIWSGSPPCILSILSLYGADSVFRNSQSHSTHNILSLWNLQVHYCVHWSPPMATTLSQLNPINIRSFNMYLSSHLLLGLPRIIFPSVFRLCVSCSHACYI